MTFTNWFNDRLGGSKSSYSGPKVRDLTIDLQDGILLIRLLENLTGKKFREVEKTPKITAQKMVNLDLAFEFMRAEGIKLIGIGELGHSPILITVAYGCCIHIYKNIEISWFVFKGSL